MKLITGKFDILFVSPLQTDNIYDILKNLDFYFERMVIDEADTILPKLSNKFLNDIKYNFTILITSTPQSLLSYHDPKKNP